MIDITALLNSLSLDEAYVLLKPLVMFIIGVVVYSIFIFKAYRLVAARDIFEGKKRYKEFKEGLKSQIKYTQAKRAILHLFEYVFFYPFVVFFFFIFFFVLLMFLSESPNMSDILLIAIAMVGSIRILSYYSEDLSKDFAKTLPFALLAIYLIDVPTFSFSASFDAVIVAFSNPFIIILLVYCLLFLIVLEFILRILRFIWG